MRLISFSYLGLLTNLIWSTWGRGGQQPSKLTAARGDGRTAAAVSAVSVRDSRAVRLANDERAVSAALKKLNIVSYKEGGGLFPGARIIIFYLKRRGRCGTFGQKIISGACFLAPELSNFTHTRVGRNICNTIITKERKE